MGAVRNYGLQELVPGEYRFVGKADDARPVGFRRLGDFVGAVVVDGADAESAIFCGADAVERVLEDDGAGNIRADALGGTLENKGDALVRPELGAGEYSGKKVHDSESAQAGIDAFPVGGGGKDAGNPAGLQLFEEFARALLEFKRFRVRLENHLAEFGADVLDCIPDSERLRDENGGLLKREPFHVVPQRF